MVRDDAAYRSVDRFDNKHDNEDGVKGSSGATTTMEETMAITRSN